MSRAGTGLRGSTLVALTIALGTWTLPAQASEDPFAALAIQRPATAELAPDLALPSLDGGTVRLKDFRGRVVLLGFFTTS